MDVAKLIVARTDTGDLVRNHQMVLRIDRCLNGVADSARATSHHGTGVWIGQ